jgi:hypothetical protein
MRECNIAAGVRLSLLMLPICMLASCQTAKVTEPCDVLVAINPKPSTNSYLIANDRQTAVSIAQHRGRFQAYHCDGT